MPRKKSVPVNLEEALKTLQSLGFKVTPPSSSEEKVLQEESVEKLGFTSPVKAKKSTKKTIEKPKVLKGYLGIEHHISGQIYGPGEIVLPIEQASLFNSLLHQDQLARKAHYDSVQTNPYSRCFMIQTGTSSDRYNRFTKREVSESQFNSDYIWDNPSIVTGKQDIAGSNSTVYQNNRPF